jgi:hypothetical protein
VGRVISLLSLGMRRLIVLGCGGRPRAPDGGRAAEDVLTGGRATDVLGGGRPIGGWGGGRAAELLKDNGRGMTLEADGRTEAVVGGLTLGLAGAVGLNDVGVGMGGRTVLGLTVGPIGPASLDVEEDAAGRAGMAAGLGAVLEVLVVFAGLRADGGFGLSLLESLVRSTISLAFPLLLSFGTSFAGPLITVSSDRSMTRLAFTVFLSAGLLAAFSFPFPLPSGWAAELDPAPRLTAVADFDTGPEVAADLPALVRSCVSLRFAFSSLSRALAFSNFFRSCLLAVFLLAPPFFDGSSPVPTVPLSAISSWRSCSSRRFRALRSFFVKVCSSADPGAAFPCSTLGSLGGLFDQSARDSPSALRFLISPHFFS